jgi:antirestriction protein ArdC
MEAKDLKAIVDEGIKVLMEQLKAGNSEALTNYLRTMGRFHNYSFGNVMAIARQKPDATRVAGFRNWIELGRHVKKGEKGIAILAPLIGKRRSQDAGEQESPAGDSEQPERIVYGFRGVYVFDISQTDGDPLPEFTKASGDAGDTLDRLTRFAESQGIMVEIVSDGSLGSAEGASYGGKIKLADGRTQAETVTTLIHELGHEILEHKKRRQEVSKVRRELEAEAVSFVVGSAIGLEMNTSSADYIRMYEGDADMLAESLESVSKASGMILDAITTAKAARKEW